MQFLRQIHFMKFFQNKELTHFYISILLINFGVALISIFIPIYFYNLGFSISKIIFFYFLWSLFFVILSYPCTKIISKIGVKHSMLLAAPFLIFFYLCLNFIENYNILFYFLPIIYSLNSIFYWQGYHLFFFLHHNEKSTGKEVSISTALSLIAVSIAPFIGGIIASESFTILFLIGSFFILISSIPLFLTKENHTPVKFTLKSIYKDVISSQENKNFLSFAGNGISVIIDAIIWPIYIILILGTLVKTGFVISITTFVSLIGLYISGILTDKFSKVKLVRIFGILHSFSWFARIFVSTITGILLIDSYKKANERLLNTPWASKIYSLAGKRDYVKFIFFMHWSFHLTRVLFLPIIMIVFYIDYYPFIITFIITGIASLFYIFISKD